MILIGIVCSFSIKYVLLWTLLIICAAKCNQFCFPVLKNSLKSDFLSQPITQKCVVEVGIVYICWLYKAEEEDFEFYALTSMSSSVSGNNIKLCCHMVATPNDMIVLYILMSKF